MAGMGLNLSIPNKILKTKKPWQPLLILFFFCRCHDILVPVENILKIEEKLMIMTNTDRKIWIQHITKKALLIIKYSISAINIILRALLYQY